MKIQNFRVNPVHPIYKTKLDLKKLEQKKKEEQKVVKPNQKGFSIKI